MLKTIIMTTGEFEFDTIFVNDQGLIDNGLIVPFPTLTTILWIIFVVTMPILFSNLLVGNRLHHMHYTILCGRLVSQLVILRKNYPRLN